MKNIYHLLNRFKVEEDNLVVGGTTALKLHGLKLPQEPDDVDIIIYNPTEHQLIVFKTLVSVNNAIKSDLKYSRRSVKIELDNVMFNFILEWEKKPEGLLWANLEGVLIQIQSIQNVFEAQKSYHREKDLKRSIKLKELNFNLF